MKTLLTIVLLLAAAFPVAAGDFCPQNNFTYVVAYCYDYSKDKRGAQIVQKDGTHHTGIISATTVRLSTDQGKKLQRLLLVPPKEHPGTADCFMPHHAFVFYDESWNPKAHISVCFLCGNFEAQPENISRTLDLRGLQRFSNELGLPVFRGRDAPTKYAELYRRLEHSEPVGARQSATVPDSKSEGKEKSKPKSKGQSR